jgi:hypothetical protein
MSPKSVSLPISRRVESSEPADKTGEISDEYRMLVGKHHDLRYSSNRGACGSVVIETLTSRKVEGSNPDEVIESFQFT